MDPINPIAGNPEALNPNPQPPKDSHGITIAALAGFILLSLAAVAFLYYQNQQLKTMLASYQQVQATPAPSATPDPTANWKTYTNTKYDYSIKYPDGWKITSGEPGPGEIPLNTTSRGLNLYPSKYKSSATAKVFIEIFVDGPENTAFKSYDDWLAGTQQTFFKITSTVNQNFAGLPAQVSTGTYDGYGFPATIKRILFRNAESTHYFSLTETAADNDSDVLIATQILSTFKFLTSNTLVPADEQSPTAGTCLPAQGTTVTITLNQDIPNPRCVIVSSEQMLDLVNNTTSTVALNYGGYSASIAPYSGYSFVKPLGEIFSPGVHRITTSLYSGGGPEVWLK